MNILINGDNLKKVELLLAPVMEQLKDDTKEVQELFIYELVRKLYYTNKMGEHWKPLFDFCTSNLTADSHLSLNQ